MHAWVVLGAYNEILSPSESRGGLGFSEVQTDSISFNDDVFGNIFRCKMWTETRLKAIMEELLWYQESREKWVCHGNRNTEFFHSLTKIRRRLNHIHGLFLSDGERVLTRINYNQKLFSSILLSSALQILDLQIYGGGSTSQAVPFRVACVISSRGTPENVLVAQEVMHHIQHSKSKQVTLEASLIQRRLLIEDSSSGFLGMDRSSHLLRGRKIWLNSDESRVMCSSNVIRRGQKLELSQLVMGIPLLGARFVITSIPIYSAIQIFWLSQAVCEASTDKIVQDFILGREDWNAISRLRQFGGLGLRDARFLGQIIETTLRFNLEGLRWRVFDATGQVLGRLASQILTIIQGNDKPTDAPCRDDGDICAVLNAKDVYRTPQGKEFKRLDGQGPYRSHPKSCSAPVIFLEIAIRVFFLLLVTQLDYATIYLQYLLCLYALQDRDRKQRIFPDSEHPFGDQPLEPYVQPPRKVRAMIRAKKKANQQEQGGNDKKREVEEELTK
uniref:Uncharacterized protein n=1 Tax=Salix viminalis TaxID=40686 RepID=A0A6N2KP30_SALVM